MTLSVIDLFSGIGGFSLGLEAAGFQTVQFCEIDPYCQKVLKKHWPEIPCHDDIKTYTPARGAADLVCGGYPCQPFSTAGKRQGEADERHLWPEMLRIIQSVRPRYVIAENVAGHIELGFDEVAASLAVERYTVWSFIIPACAVDAYHRRDRVWIVAHRQCERLERYPRNVTNRHQPGRDNAEANGSVSPPGVCRPMADAESGAKRAGFCQNEPTGLWRRRFSDSHSEDGSWLPEPDVGRVAYGVPNRVDRLKGLGNAIVPQIAQIIGQAVMMHAEAT